MAKTKGTPKKLLSDYIEVRSHGMYSAVAEELGLTIQQVETVYEWYMSKTLTEVKEKPTVKVKLSGLGTLVFDVKKACKFLYNKILFYQNHMSHSNLWPSAQNPREYYMQTWQKYGALLDKTDKLFERAVGKKYYTPLQEKYYGDFLKAIRNHHNNFYESIQRVFGNESEWNERYLQGNRGDK